MAPAAEFALAAGILGLVAGGGLCASILLCPRRSGDPGLRWLLVPFAPHFLLAFLEHFRLAGASFGFLGGEGLFFLSSTIRLFIGLGWALFCHRHYALNGVVDFRQRLSAPLAVLNSAAAAVHIGSFFFPRPAFFDALAAFISDGTAFYAAVSGLLLLRRTNQLLPSSWAGVAIAGISITVCPPAFASDVLGVRYPFIVGDVPMWVLAQPFYFLLISFVALPFVRASFLREPAERTGTDLSVIDGALSKLSGREREVASLLYSGLTYKEMAAKLGLSVATVKTHVVRIYGKFGVRRRSDFIAGIAEKDMD